MLKNMVSWLPVESLVAISSKDSVGGKLRVRKSLNPHPHDRKMHSKTTTLSP